MSKNAFSFTPWMAMIIGGILTYFLVGIDPTPTAVQFITWVILSFFSLVGLVAIERNIK